MAETSTYTTSGRDFDVVIAVSIRKRDAQSRMIIDGGAFGLVQFGCRAIVWRHNDKLDSLRLNETEHTLKMTGCRVFPVGLESFAL